MSKNLIKNYPLVQTALEIDWILNYDGVSANYTKTEYYHTEYGTDISAFIKEDEAFTILEGSPHNIVFVAVSVTCVEDRMSALYTETYTRIYSSRSNH